MKYAWIDGQRGSYPLPALYATLGVSLSGYQASKRGGTTNRKHLSNPQLLTLIRSIHAKLKGAYQAAEIPPHPVDETVCSIVTEIY